MYCKSIRFCDHSFQIIVDMFFFFSKHLEFYVDDWDKLKRTVSRDFQLFDQIMQYTGPLEVFYLRSPLGI